MRKVAIVGVEGSGKTVMLAGLGDLYSHPDAMGYFLTPQNYQTAAYVSAKIARMRKGEWPAATAEDAMQGLGWSLKRRRDLRQRPEVLCEVSCLDFAGEVYRSAFGIRRGQIMTNEVVALKEYIRNADDLIVLINLHDIIVQGVNEPRVQEAMWITNEILSSALDESGGRKAPRAAIVLSQADSYADTIRACNGPRGVLAKYLPHVANNYNWLDIFAASAVDKTVLDDDGNLVPAPDFQASNLRVIMRWIIAGLDASTLEPTLDSNGEIHFRCPCCYEVIDAPGEMAGNEGECASCGNSVLVPHPAPAAPQPAAQPQQPPSPVASQPAENGEGGGSWWQFVGSTLFFIFMLAKVIKGCQ